MRINADEIRSTVEQVRRLLQQETTLFPTLRATLEMLLMVVTILFNRIGLNSRNSSKPPSDDPKAPWVLSVAESWSSIQEGSSPMPLLIPGT